MFCTKNCDRGNIHTAGRLRATLAARLCGIRATSGASCSQIRCPTTRTRLLLLQKKIPQTEHWLFAKITIKIAITRFIPSCCNVIDLLTLVLLTPLFTCKCDRAAVTPLKHQLVLQRCYTGVLFEWNHSQDYDASQPVFRSGTEAQNGGHSDIGGGG